MKGLYKVVFGLFFCLGLSGCFIFSSGGSSSQISSQTKSISQRLVKRWNFKQSYKVVGSRTYDLKTQNSSYIQFYSNGTCYENGFLGTSGREQLRWSLSGRQLRIYGKNLVYADGNVSGTEVSYTIDVISDNELQLSRWDGKQNGANIVRKLIFY